MPETPAPTPAQVLRALYLWLGPRDAANHVLPPEAVTEDLLMQAYDYTPEWRRYLCAMAAALRRRRHA